MLEYLKEIRYVFKYVFFYNNKNVLTYFAQNADRL